MKRTICILSFSAIQRDARVLRQIKYLADVYNLIVVGYGQPHPAFSGQVTQWLDISKKTSRGAGNRKVQGILNRLALAGGRIDLAAYDYWYWNLKNGERRNVLGLLDNLSFDAIHANDWNTLPVAVEAARRKKNCGVVFDSHEYGPQQNAEQLGWRLFNLPAIRYILGKYLPYVNAGITVSEPIAERFERELACRMLVVMNAPDLAASFPVQKSDPEKIKLIHHGIAARNRKLEQMIKAVALADKRYELHFMLVESGASSYIAQLKDLAQKIAPERVHFHKTVDPVEIIQTLSAYDVGFYILEPTNFNNAAALPNKFFDFMAAKLAVCIGPSTAMAGILQKYGFGCVADSFDPVDVADTLNHLSHEDIAVMKHAAEKASLVINAQTEANKMLDLYESLFSGIYRISETNLPV